IAVKLVGADLPPNDLWQATDIPAEHAIRRIRGATILSEAPEETASFISRHFGWRRQARDGAVERLISHADNSIDTGDAHGFWPGLRGTGIADHVALRSPDVASLRQ